MWALPLGSGWRFTTQTLKPCGNKWSIIIERRRGKRTERGRQREDRQRERRGEREEGGREREAEGGRRERGRGREKVERCTHPGRKAGEETGRGGAFLKNRLLLQDIGSCQGAGSEY